MAPPPLDIPLVPTRALPRKITPLNICMVAPKPVKGRRGHIVGRGEEEAAHCQQHAAALALRTCPLCSVGIIAIRCSRMPLASGECRADLSRHWPPKLSTCVKPEDCIALLQWTARWRGACPYVPSDCMVDGPGLESEAADGAHMRR
jgi:hypothetical protein